MTSTPTTSPRTQTVHRSSFIVDRSPSPFRIQHSAFSISRAFTLIELLVVVAIIVLLIAILLPALGSAKRSARIAETKSLLTSLSTDIEAYFTTFHAYPGPANSAQTTAGGSSNPTGTQNLLLGLSYALNATVVPKVPILGGNANPTTPTGPVDFSSTDPNGNYRSYAAFYNPTATELSPGSGGATPTWPSSGVVTTSGTTAAPFPTILDRFPDALPILYYRKTPGVDGTATFNTSTGNVTAQFTPPIVAAGTASTGNISAFYLNDNLAYTSGKVTSLSGTVYSQNLSLFDLATEICSPNSTGAATSTATSHGGYALISAGPDRLYGGGNKTDDIIVVGGQ